MRCWIAFLVLWVSVGAGAMQIDSPKDYQVFQRQTKLVGKVLMAGKAEGKLEYRLTGKPLAGALPGEWRGVEVDGKLGAFRAEVETPAGGWYLLEFRVNGAAAGAVEHVGVGEVFVVAGQSNSTNYGAEKQKPASGRVVSFDGTKWAIANDPQPGVFDKSKGGSFIPAFGDAMVKKFGVPVAIASTGAGATSVRQWLMKGEKIEVHPTLNSFVKTVGLGEWECTGELYDHLTKRVKALGPHGFRGALAPGGVGRGAGTLRLSGRPADQRRAVHGAAREDHPREPERGGVGDPVVRGTGDVSHRERPGGRGVSGGAEAGLGRRRGARRGG